MGSCISRHQVAPFVAAIVWPAVIATLAAPGRAALDEVTPAQWLAAQPKPVFRPGHTLPRLARWGWGLPQDVRVELAEHWGYALEFGGTDDVGVQHAIDVPASDSGRILALAARDPRRYPLCVIVSRALPARLPPETWTRDAAGRPVPPQGAAWSPEAPPEVIRAVAEVRAAPLRKIRAKAPIAIILNGGENALSVVGPSRKYWEQDPRILAAKGNSSWYEYVSRRKGEMETAIADACRRAVPDRTLYVYYAAGGVTFRNFYPGWEDSAFDFKWMRTACDLPSEEYYYKSFNDGWTGNRDVLTGALNSKGLVFTYGQPLSYDWLNGGSLDESKPPLPRAGRTTQPVFDPDGRLSDMRLYAGFLKCIYTAGTIGGVAGYFNLPPGGFGHRFPPDRPPHWLRQMTTLAQVHALFSFQEPFVRASDLLPGPDKHRWSKDQPAYEFPTEPGVRVLARRHKTRPEWLITAWAADGRARNVTCQIPELGDVVLNARPEGSVYFISLAGATPRVQWQDQNVVISAP
jgi:hypothetical protein